MSYHGHCKCCEIIYWFLTNEKNIPFEDTLGSTLHMCKRIPNSSGQRFLNIEDDIRILYHLVDSIINRTSELKES